MPKLLSRTPEIVPRHEVTKPLLWRIDPPLSVSHGLLSLHARGFQHPHKCLGSLES